MAIINQKQIYINKKNKEKKYSILNHSSLMEAMSNLSDTGIRLWLYLYTNKNGFTLNLYQGQVMSICNFSHGTYYKTIKELINKNYLRITNPKENLYTFYESAEMNEINIEKLNSSNLLKSNNIIQNNTINNTMLNNTYGMNNININQENISCEKIETKEIKNKTEDKKIDSTNIERNNEFDLDKILSQALSGSVLKDTNDINNFFEKRGEDPIEFTDEDFETNNTNNIKGIKEEGIRKTEIIKSNNLENDNLVSNKIIDNESIISTSCPNKNTYGIKPIKDPISNKIYPNDYEQYQIDFIENPMNYNGKIVTEDQYWELRDQEDTKYKEEYLKTLPKINPIKPGSPNPSDNLSQDDELPDLLHNRSIKSMFDYFQKKVKKPIHWNNYREYHKYIKQTFEKTYMNDNKNKKKGTYQELTEEQINAICVNMIHRYTDNQYKDKYKNDFLSVLYSFSIQDVLDQYDRNQKFLEQDSKECEKKEMNKKLRKEYYIHYPEKIPKPIVPKSNQFSVDFSKDDYDVVDDSLFTAIANDFQSEEINNISG